MPYRELSFTVKFLTPAFLGDADQNGRWRTPPFKHLLREWWRVAYAADKSFAVDVEAMRREEGLLFGNAWLSHHEDGREVADHCKSLVRIRLARWDEGRLKKAQWPKDDETVGHPEVGKLVGSALYLGYGPLVFSSGTALKANAAVQAGEEALLSLAWPDVFPAGLHRAMTEAGAPPARPERIDARLRRALWLADRYGALGGRARNGWGSFALQSGEGTALAGSPRTRPWRDCLQRDWPHAIGLDDKGPLIWQTNAHDDWKPLMKALAVVKIGLRTQFTFPKSSPPHAGIEDRHWLSYPITKHTTLKWERSARLPNQLRFKVRQAEDGRLVGVIFHMPHLPPPAFSPDNRASIERVWERVHRFLDDPAQKLTRIAA